jgi:hypothetical protein
VVVAGPLATANPHLPVQGSLVDAGGAPIDGSRAVTFSLYADDQTASPLWFEPATVAFIDGSFNAHLGATTAIPAAILDDEDLWLGVTVTGVGEAGRVRVGYAPRAVWAAAAGDAQTLDGHPATDFYTKDEDIAWSSLDGALHPSAATGYAAAAPLAVSAGSNPTFSLPRASAGAHGYLHQADFAAFAAKADAASLGGLATRSSVTNTEIAANAAIAAGKLAGGAEGQVLATVAGAPAWATTINMSSAANPGAAGSPTWILSGDTNKERLHVRSAGADPTVSIYRSRGTSAAPANTKSADFLGFYQLGGWDGASWMRSAWITAQAAEDYDSTHLGSNLLFYTTPLNSGPAVAERMRLDHNGQLGIGTPSPAAKLHVNGDARVDGQIQMNGTTMFRAMYSGSASVQYSNGVWFNLFNSTQVGLTTDGDSGTYIVKVGPIHTPTVGGSIYGETAVFLLQMHQGTNSVDVTNVPLTFGGHAPNTRTISARMARTTMASDKKSYLQLAITESLTSPVAIPWQAIRVF